MFERYKIYIEVTKFISFFFLENFTRLLLFREVFIIEFFLTLAIHKLTIQCNDNREGRKIFFIQYFN